MVGILMLRVTVEVGQDAWAGAFSTGLQANDVPLK
jgi:hypothetical protein